MGLLDGFFATSQDDPRYAMNLGLFAGIARGDVAGGLMAAQEAQAKREFQKMSLENMRSEMEQRRMALEKARRDDESERGFMDAAKSSYRTPQQAIGLSTGPMPDGSAMPTVQPGFDSQHFLSQAYGINPLKAMQFEQSLAKDDKPITVAPGASLVHPKTFKPVFTAPDKADKPPSSVQEYEYAKSQGFTGSFAQFQLAMKRAGASSVSVNTKQEGEESKAVGKFFGENYADVQKAGLTAQSSLNRLDRLGQLLDGVDTGKFAPLGVEVSKAAQSFGLNIDPKLANKEAAVALSSEIALQLRNPSGGAGMPGAMSDADRNFLSGMVPGIEKTPEGRKLILETAKKMAQRDVQVARMAREFRQKRGTINEGFYDELARFSEANPLFKGVARTTQGGQRLTAQEQQELEALRKQFGR